jgi:arsenite-transporting ATPase
MKRVIIFTGKGGVGKSSTASAHALKSAKMGKKTLIVSTDMAHNLSDIFDENFANDEIKLDENLWGLEINPGYEMENNFGEIKNSLLKMFKFNKEEDKETFEDIMIFPGIEEIFSLLKILNLYESNKYDVIIVDCAPTGETLSLLKFPELINWYMEKFFPIEKFVAKIARPFVSRFFRMEIPNEEAMNDIEKLYVKMINYM